MRLRSIELSVIDCLNKLDEISKFIEEKEILNFFLTEKKTRVKENEVVSASIDPNKGATG